MCGIAGRLEPASAIRDELIEQMCASIRHRGPDEDGFLLDPDVALGMRRLAIQDVMHGHQPVFNERGSVAVVFNGEIYNVGELQQMLRGRGHHLASESDTECIPHLYEEFGLDFVQHLRGMFAIALWDRSRRRLVLVRDRLGKKPLFYRAEGDRINFASELKALLVDPSIPRRADAVAIHHYLTFQYVPAPWSAVEGVNKLPPGHLLVHDAEGTSVRRYWNLDYAPEGSTVQSTDEELAEELRERLTECVSVRLLSERPLGAFLSGGLDSSAVVAAMSRVSGHRVKTFSIGFDDESLNELPFARRVAERFDTDHHELVIKPEALDVIPRLASMFDEPYADSSAIPSWYLAQMAAEHVVVALNGDGGDEALGGYTRYLRYLAGGERSLPTWSTDALFRAGTCLRRHSRSSRLVRKASSAALLYAESDPVRRYGRFLSYFRPEEKSDIYSVVFAQRVAEHESYDLVGDVWEAQRGTDLINRLLAVDTATYLPGDLLPKVDITTMSVSLEARSPFLDHTFVEWCASLPGDRKIVGQSGKHLLKKALEGWIDDDLIYRRKQGFGVPLDDWLRGPLRDLVHDCLTDATAVGREYFQAAKVRSLLDAHMRGENHAPRVYALLMLELWHREVLG